MPREIQIGSRSVGDGHPTYIVGEIGINHNGDVEIAKKLIEMAKWSGVDAIKFQKRTPEVCTPRDQWDKMRETPWGYISYIEYRHKIEFGLDEYHQIDEHCEKVGIDWFVSVWDEPSVDFMEEHFDTVGYKLPSASLTDHDLIRKVRGTGRALIMSTGMSMMEEIYAAMGVAGTENLLLCHTTSSYPCPENELNLKMIDTLRNTFPNVPVGYSGHEVGILPSVIAVAFGACFVERHITLDRAMWGSDQAASVEPGGLFRLVKNIRLVPDALGDGVKKVYESERSSREKLRRVK
ncbi:MAG: N-acetylneuraminate synthase [Anaerolineae bacterium]|nr:N-acetylneuraminate synthase [Anaerolineae bacterium]